MTGFTWPQGVGLEHPLGLAAGLAAALLILAGPRVAPRGYAAGHPLAPLLRLGGWRSRPLLLAAAALLAGLAASAPFMLVREEARIHGTVNQTLAVKPRPAVVLVIDVSGSMAGEKLEAAKRALLAFAEKAVSRVDVGVAAFSDRLVASLPPTGNLSEVRRLVESLEAGGGTMYSVGLSTALSMLKPYRLLRTPAAIVFASDGMPGDPDIYPALVEEAKRLGIPIYTVYIGPAAPAARSVLASIAQSTGGEAYSVEDAGQLVSLYRRLEARIERRLTMQAEIEAHVPVTRRVYLSHYPAAAAALLAAAGLYRRQRLLGAAA